MALFGKHLFPDSVPDHIRLYTRPCIFEHEDISALVYPQITLYADGVLLAAFKVLSGDKILDTTQFVSSIVNFPLREANSVRVPVALLREFLLIDQVRTGQVLSRMSGVLGHLSNPTERFIRAYEYNEVDLGTSRSYFLVRKEWVPEAERSEVSALTLRGLSERIEDAIAWAASPRTDQAKSAIHRSDPLRPLVGGTWVGRPEIHLIDYDTKPQAKSYLPDTTKQHFVDILARTETPLSVSSAKHLFDKDLRMFDDYSVFINESVNLFCYYGDLTIEDSLDKHAQIEFVDYLNAAHHMVEWDVQHTDFVSAKMAQGTLVRLYDFENTIRRGARFGEIRELVASATEELNIRTTRERIQQVIQIKQAYFMSRLEARSRSFGWLITIIGGVLGAPALGSGVVLPLMSVAGIFTDLTEPAKQLLGTSVALVTWFLAAAALWGLFAPRN